MSRLVVFPRRAGKHKKSDSSKEEIQEIMQDGKRKIHMMPKTSIADGIKLHAVSEVSKSDMPEGTEDAYRKLRSARSDARLVGVRAKRAYAKAEEEKK